MPAPTTILIIDDDSRNIFALTAVLRARKYHCLTALDMAEAFTIMSSGTHIDIILLDMMLPEMDGYQAIPRIKALEAYKQTPIIAVTAQAMVGDKERCLAAGADAYIAKPVEMDELDKLLKQYLNKA